MHILKILSLPTITASLVLLAGCSTQTATNTESASGGNANVANDNATVEVVADTNETVVNDNANTNANTEQASDVDISYWQTYRSDELVLSFSYPKPDGRVEYFTSNCEDDECFAGKIVGWKYVGNEAIPRSYILAAAVSDDFAADRDSWPTDYSYFEKKDGDYYLKGSKLVGIEKSGVVSGHEYIIYKLNSFSPMVDDSLSDAYVAVINFPERKNNTFRALTIYFENPTSLDDVVRSIESVKFE